MHEARKLRISKGQESAKDEKMAVILTRMLRVDMDMEYGCVYMQKP